MRHVLSLIYGLLAAPVAWLAAAVGASAYAYATAGDAATGESWADTKLIAYAFFALAGIVLGLLATLRLSPAGPLLAGVLFIGAHVIAVNKAEWLDLTAVTDPLQIQGGALTIVAAGFTPVVAGVMLLTAALSAGRWRGDAKDDDAAAPPATGTQLGSNSFDDPYSQQPIDPFAPSAPTYEPAPPAPAQPSMYVDDEAETTQLPQKNPPQPPHDPNQPPPFPPR